MDPGGLLLATDPLRARPVAFALVDQNDVRHTRRFLKNLKAHGFAPEVVVTDGSPLYPALLAEVWPDARHQLRVFHVLQEIHAKVLGAVRRLRRPMARRGTRGRKRGRGRPPKSRSKPKGLTNQEKARYVFKRRYLVVKRRDNLSDQERDALATMLAYMPALATLRSFADRIYDLFEGEQSAHRAKCHRSTLLRSAEFAAIPELAGAMGMLTEEKFARMIAFLASPAGHRVRTNNDVERTNRRTRSRVIPSRQPVGFSEKSPLSCDSRRNAAAPSVRPPSVPPWEGGRRECRRDGAASGPAPRGLLPAFQADDPRLFAAARVPCSLPRWGREQGTRAAAKSLGSSAR